MKELSLLYTSGIEKFATGAWEFFISGRSQWQAQKELSKYFDFFYAN